jgi:hypothetical protein
MTAQDQVTPPEVADFAEFTAAWQAWHAGQEARLADPHGFLAITSLHWLTETPQRFDDALGAWHTGPDGVTVELADGEELVIGGAAVRGWYSFGTIPERGGVNAGWGDAVIEVARRGGHYIVRPRHPDTPLRVSSPARRPTRRIRGGPSPAVMCRSPSRDPPRWARLWTGSSTSTTLPGGSSSSWTASH